MKNYPRGPVYIEHADGSVSGVLEDVIEQGSTTIKDVQQAVFQGSDQLLSQFMGSDQFQKVLSEVDASARDAVRKEASENAWNLFLLAVAGGAVGGMVLRGKTGAVLAGLLAFYAMSQISDSGNNVK